ncbi:hypothetical protein [Dehalogenimonas alkenigignens]|uniref:hypothetical protein n=1 Tax=Dehalogenimonas alkenigignens TaxID=1217799 RepID=UPI001187646D|nr:hypothetical protein [Dehalogenimonas alkenigignens]
MKRAYLIAAIGWLTALAGAAVLASILRPSTFHITWNPAQFLDPLKFFTVGLPAIALVLLTTALFMNRGRPQVAEILVRVAFVILFALSLIAVVSIFGGLIAPAACFTYMATWQIKKSQPA